MKDRRKNKILIFSLLGLLCIMTVGYAAFQSNLKIKGTSSVSGNWDIRITNVTEGTKTGSGTTTLDENGNQKITFDELTASVEADLIEVNDAVEYNVTVENKGNINAKLDSIDLIKTNNTGIKFTVTMLKDGKEITDINEMKKYPLNAGELANFKIKIEYETKVEAPISSELSITLNYAQLTGNLDTPVIPDNQLKTIYAYHTDTKNIGISTLSEKDYKIDYTELESYKSGKTWFLKYNIDAEGVIQDAYACQKFTFIDEPVCLQGYQNSEGNTYYDNNIAILENLKTIFNSNSGTCSLEVSPSYCISGYFLINTRLDGRVYAYDNSSNFYCGIGINGTTVCVE